MYLGATLHTSLLAIILLPLLAGTVLCGLTGSLRRPGHRALTACVAAFITATSLGLLLLLAPTVMGGAEVRSALPWVPEIGLNIALRLDVVADDGESGLAQIGGHGRTHGPQPDHSHGILHTLHFV